MLNYNFSILQISDLIKQCSCEFWDRFRVYYEIGKKIRVQILFQLSFRSEPEMTKIMTSCCSVTLFCQKLKNFKLQFWFDNEIEQKSDTEHLNYKQVQNCIFTFVKVRHLNVIRSLQTALISFHLVSKMSKNSRFVFVSVKNLTLSFRKLKNSKTKKKIILFCVIYRFQQFWLLKTHKIKWVLCFGSIKKIKSIFTPIFFYLSNVKLHFWCLLISFFLYLFFIFLIKECACIECNMIATELWVSAFLRILRTL